MTKTSSAIVLCNGANEPKDHRLPRNKVHNLSYLAAPDTPANVRIDLPSFVRDVYHLPNRVLDLLELAAYIYCADRKVSRGAKHLVEYQSWARSFHIVIKVRDYEFWKRPEIAESLAKALTFMTGDQEYRFTFQPGHSTQPTSLFDAEQFQLDSPDDQDIMLFSGGLDSLAGAIRSLETAERQLCLVSHQSQPGTRKTQNSLYRALRERYGTRISHYRFACHLRGHRAIEETQRTRSFLYTSIACAIAEACSRDRFTIYENGITSMNFPRREDLVSARASRTTHPRTIQYLEAFFSLMLDRRVEIATPFLWKTKSDVFQIVQSCSYPELLPSSVSCSRTFKNFGMSTHCGECSQCIDRRFAAYASNGVDLDGTGIYAADIITQSISGPDARETRTTVVDYIRQARDFRTWNDDHFLYEMVNELSELLDWLPHCSGEQDAFEKVRVLCRRHGAQIEKGIQCMRDMHENLYENLEEGSLLQIVSNREYLKSPTRRLIESLHNLLATAVPRMFSRNRPLNEPDLNDKINSLLESHQTDLKREHPVVAFAAARAIPDHGSDTLDVLIESKYIRKGTFPSKASDGMAADLTKYPQEAYILFLVYDPDRAIREEEVFKRDFESPGRCSVLILR